MRHAPTRYLIVPGWHGSGVDHWQTHWQHLLPNAARVEQHDWENPTLTQWVAQLEQAIVTEPAPVVLIAHSLGCVTVAHWAQAAAPGALARVAGALLVAPADVERRNCAPALRGFAPLPYQPLPFSTLLVGSSNDPAASRERALVLGEAWGSHTLILEQAGHINTASGFTRWEAGFAHLYQLQHLIDQRAQQQA